MGALSLIVGAVACVPAALALALRHRIPVGKPKGKLGGQPQSTANAVHSLGQGVYEMLLNQRNATACQVAGHQPRAQLRLLSLLRVPMCSFDRIAGPRCCNWVPCCYRQQ